MPTATAHIAALAALVALVTTACDDDASGGAKQAPPETALQHAETCQSHLGPIPQWACRDGVEIPIHVQGERVTTTPESCDAADLKGSCIVGSYVGHLEGKTADGTPNPDVNWVYFCRRNDDFAQMIGWNRQSGAACFFELQNGYLPLEDGIPVGTVPGVDDPEYEAAWKPPAAIAVQGCNNCHSPDPFIHTPFVDAARRPDDETKPVVPELATPKSKYFVPGDAFADWTFDYVEFDDNACTTCHRMPDFRRFTFGSMVDFNEHMPPLAPGSMKDAFDAVMDCLTRGPDVAAGCQWAALNGAPPTQDNPPGKDDALRVFEGTGAFETAFATLDAAEPYRTGDATLTVTELPFDYGDIGAVAGLEPGGRVRLDVTGRAVLPDLPQGIRAVARFLVPVATFTPGAVLAAGDPGFDGELWFEMPDRNVSDHIGRLTEGTLTLDRAGTEAGDIVEGSFDLSWSEIDIPK